MHWAAVMMGNPKSWNDRTAQRQNGRTAESRNAGKWPQILKYVIAERRKMTPNSKRRKSGTAEDDPKFWKTEPQRIPWNPKRRNDRKCPEILKDAMTEITRILKRRNDGKSPEILKDGMMENHPISQKREL